MKSELSFLVELLLEHKIPKPTQKAVKDRIAEVEAMMSRGDVTMSRGGLSSIQPQVAPMRITPVATRPAAPSDQPESTRKLLEKYPDLAPKGIKQAAPVEPIGIPEPEVHGVNTAAVAGALAQRQQMIMEGIAGPKKGSMASPKAHGTPRG